MQDGPCDVRKGQQGGKPSRPSKFQPGKINHYGYKSDAGGRILPWWPNPSNPNSPDPNQMNYKPVKPDLKEPTGQRLKPGEGVDGPPGPPVWESAETIEKLYKLLDSVGCRLQLSQYKNDKSRDNEQKQR